MGITSRVCDALRGSTVGINVVGSFLLGLLVAGSWFVPRRPRRGVGLLEKKPPSRRSPSSSCSRPRAAAPGWRSPYVLASVLGGIAAAWAGYGARPLRWLSGLSPEENVNESSYSGSR